MIGIRADANNIIASGHVMRCITIAQELIALGERVTFFVADNEGKGLIENYAKDFSNFEVVVLGSAYDHMEEELPALEKELTKRDIRALLVDSYFVTKRYFETLSGICAVAYMDDLGKEPYPVDILINYSGYYENIGYESLYKGTSGHNGIPTKFLLGLKYAPLRRQFYENGLSAEKATKDINVSDSANIPSNYDNDTLRILLTAGGADIHGMLLSTLEAAGEKGMLTSKGGSVGISDKQSVIWEVVVGNLVASSTQIDTFSEQFSNINIHRSVTNMASLMRSCDLAVAAAGTMLTECAAVRLPAIFYQVADNQKFNVEFWQKTGGMIFAGDVTGDNDHSSKKKRVIETICCNVRALSKSPDKLSSMRRALSGLTDGTGASLIAEELIDLEINTSF